MARAGAGFVAGQSCVFTVTLGWALPRAIMGVSMVLGLL